MPDMTKESSQSITRGNFRFGYKQDPPDVSTDNIGPKIDSIKDANQSKSYWSQSQRHRQEAVYQKTSSSSYGIPDSQYLDKIAKFQEFATLVQKYYSKDTKELIICASRLRSPQNWEHGSWIEEKLVFLRNLDRVIT